MKKIVFLFPVLAVLLLAGCADPNGLHNQKQSLVSFQFIDFPLPDGDYAVSGNWQGTLWDNTKANVTLKSGAGLSSEQAVKSSYAKFTITPVGVWSRNWYPATIGNAPDETQGNVLWNFDVNGLPMDSELTITIDGGKKPAVITWK
ncbi:MAG: hypothetical protein FWF29_00145 [Treponema sp.]|nr:hypothetical protein [Treponema sp.]